MSALARLYVLLIGMGALWGMTIPLSKHAVEAGHPYMGLVFWQLVFMTLAIAVVLVLKPRNGRPRGRLNRGAVAMFIAIAFTGTLIPGFVGYRAADELPAGVMSIIIAMVPMFALIIAVSIKNEDFAWRKLAGVVLGAIAIVLLVGPEEGLPEGAKIAFVFLALISPLCYGIEDNVVARFGLFGLNAVEMLFGVGIVGLIIATPITLATGTMIPLWSMQWGTPEIAIALIGTLHAVAYTGYIWMVGRAGAVFASQVAYLVTAFGIIWSILLLREAYSGWFWAALIVLMAGLFMVRPKEDAPQEPLVAE